MRSEFETVNEMQTYTVCAKRNYGQWGIVGEFQAISPLNAEDQAKEFAKKMNIINDFVVFQAFIEDSQELKDFINKNNFVD